jgi:hypothetical protein
MGPFALLSPRKTLYISATVNPTFLLSEVIMDFFILKVNFLVQNYSMTKESDFDL